MKKYSELFDEQIDYDLRSGLLDFYNGMTSMVSADKIASEEVIHDVLFSGGFDSTLILMRLVDLYRLGYIKNIETITIEGIAPPLQIKEERKSRENIFKFIKEKYDIKITNKFMRMEIFSGVSRYGYHLQHLYTSAGLIYASEKSILHTGFTGNDPSTIYFNSLKDIVKNVDNYYNANTETNIIAPLNTYSKKDIIYQLMRDYPDVYNMIWSCQSPIEKDGKITKCFKCPKCKEEIHALNNIVYENVNEDSFNNLIKIVENKINKEKEENKNIEKEVLKVEEDNK